MNQKTKAEFHLFEIQLESSKSYLLVKNIFPDPRSIKENIYAELVAVVSEQLNLLVQYYLGKINAEKEAYKEIGKMEGFPIGDKLCQNKTNKSLDIKLIRGNDNYCVFGTANSKSDFLHESKMDVEEYGVGYTNNVEEYNVYYMPSIEFLNVSDVFNHFSWCTMYDYENKKWIE